MIDALGPQRRVFLITVKVPRPWERTNNRMLRRCAAAYPPDRVHIVDWNWAASRRPHWLYSDGYHLRPTGAKNFARILAEALERADRRVDLVTTRRLSPN
jgi:lysophospholipase L1-like esterase